MSKITTITDTLGIEYVGEVVNEDSKSITIKTNSGILITKECYNPLLERILCSDITIYTRYGKCLPMQVSAGVYKVFDIEVRNRHCDSEFGVYTTIRELLDKITVGGRYGILKITTNEDTEVLWPLNS